MQHSVLEICPVFCCNSKLEVLSIPDENELPPFGGNSETVSLI